MSRSSRTKTSKNKSNRCKQSLILKNKKIIDIEDNYILVKYR